VQHCHGDLGRAVAQQLAQAVFLPASFFSTSSIHWIVCGVEAGLLSGP
jgi:hypothetical protein